MTRQTPRRENTCAVVVTYNPDADFPRRLAAVRKQVAAVVVIDNHSDAGPPAATTAAKSLAPVRVIANEGNLGIAAALNQGLRWAGENGFAWALTLDQDTTPAPGMVEHLCEAYRQCPFRGRVGVVASNFFDPVAGRTFYPAYGAARGWGEAITAITSGSLMPVAAFAEVGPFREEFFIDQVDNEYCLRLRQRGYRIIVSRRCDMSHVLGAERSVFRGYSVRVATGDYSVLRRYYITRNRLAVAREFLDAETAYVVRDLVRFLLAAGAVLLLERRRAAKLRAMLLASWHAATGKLGPAEGRRWRQRP